MNISAASDEATKRRERYAKPNDALAPNGVKKAIVAAGGTFLGRHADPTKSPAYYEDLFDFIEACHLADEFIARGLYKNEEGDYFLRDGTQVIYRPLNPSIDSTNATSEGARIEVLDVVEEIRQDYGADTDIVMIQGTDTCANTAGFYDLIIGREASYGFAIVTSQKTADTPKEKDKPKSDGPDNFWTGFDGTGYFMQVIVISDSGKTVLTGNIRKISDRSSGIYTGAPGAILAKVDVEGLLTNTGAALSPPSRKGGNAAAASMLPVTPTKRDYQDVAIYHFEPTAAGNQERQANLAARTIERSLQDTDGYTALVIKMAGSNNIPEYAEPALKATNNIIPIFASSDVPGATAGDTAGVPKYQAAGVILAERLGLNNLIELPATRVGPDMRPEAIMVYAAKYAQERSPEYLLFCHLFASLAWTSEDENYSASIRGGRTDLVGLITTLELTKGKVIAENSNAKKPELSQEELSKKILNNTYIKNALTRFVPHLVDQKGQYHLDDEKRLKLDRRSPVGSTTALGAPAP